MTIDKGVNQDTLQELNRTLVLRLIKKKGICSRADLARMTNLRPATISNIINEFQELGIVKEEGVINEGRGRNAIGVSFTLEYKIIAVRISRKFFLTGLFDLNGNVIASSRTMILSYETPDMVFAKIQEEVQHLIEEDITGKVLAIGCAIPGPFYQKEGRVGLMSGLTFSDWKHIRIKEELEEKFKIPVYLEHDANVGALAYYWDMDIERDKSLVYVAAGQGIGAGIINDGKLLVGALGTAGEIGHMSIDYDGIFCECGNRGCLEKYGSSIALTRIINWKIENGNYSTLAKGCNFNEIRLAVRQGDHLAVAEYKKACDAIAVGIVNLCYVVNPNIIVVGDEMANVETKILLKSIEEIAKPRVLSEIWENMNVIISNEDESKILLGASILAVEEIIKKPTKFLN